MPLLLNQMQPKGLRGGRIGEDQVPPLVHHQYGIGGAAEHGRQLATLLQGLGQELGIGQGYGSLLAKGLSQFDLVRAKGACLLPAVKVEQAQEPPRGHQSQG